MKRLKQIYKESDKLYHEAANIILAKIVFFCDRKNIKWNGYHSQFEDKDKQEIYELHEVHKLIREFEDRLGNFNPQFFYDPHEYEVANYIDSHMAHIKSLKRIAKKMYKGLQIID